jgi:GntR family transcriptional regulator
MLIAINPSDARPIYHQIMDEIRRALVVGTLAANDPLPSVRQLAAELRVNPNTVQQAYRELERESVVHVKRGLGTFVSEVLSQRSERQEMARSLATRALREAHRHGLSADELVEAVRAAARDEESRHGEKRR